LRSPSDDDLEEAALARHLLHRHQVLGELVSSRLLSRVYKVYSLPCSTCLALKISQFRGLDDIFEQEIRILNVSRDIWGVPVVRGDGTWQGRRYLLTDWIEGISVEEFITDDSRQRSLQSDLIMLTGISRLLLRLHERGVAHRDISPEHVIVKSEGSTWLVDFGIATFSDRVSRNAGSCFSQDILSLGLLMTELLVGKLLFAYRRPQVVRQMAPAFARLCEGRFPSCVLNIVERALSVQREFAARDGPRFPYRNMAEFVQDLNDVCRNVATES
jgi:serine/threonine protein kinase